MGRGPPAVRPTRFYTPAETEAAFYGAFQARDLEAMMAVWADEDDIACIHPTGAILTGRAAVRASWEEIFRHAPEGVRFVIDERSRAHGDTLAMHVVHEHIRVGQEPPRPPVIVTNVYRLTPAGWRMILHHASPSPKRGERAPAVLH